MPEVEFFFRGWEAVARIALIGAVGYVTLLVLLRVTGQRTLAQMTPFDMIITVTIGSAFGRVLTAENVPVVEVIVVFVVLVALQWIALGVRGRLPAVGRLMRSAPTMLYYQGERTEPALRRHRVTEADLQEAIRKSGLGSLDQAEAVILEPDGTLAVIPPSSVGDGAAIEHLLSEREGKV